MTDCWNTLSDVNLIVTNPIGRAGSLFIQSLFDSHPNVLTLPHFGALYSCIPKVVSDIDDQVDLFLRAYPAIFDSSLGYFGDIDVCVAGKFGSNGDEDLIVDQRYFRRKLLDTVRVVLNARKKFSRREFFILIHLAYTLCLREVNITEIKYIFYHPHSNDEWQALLTDFPGLYFIVMTRDPRQDWASWKRIHARRMKRNISDIPPICLFLSGYKYSKNCQVLHHLTESITDNHLRVIDLDRFHVLNRSAMEYLCDWLNLKYYDSMMKSTFNGILWSGNSSAQSKTSSFNPTIQLATWRRELSSDEIELIDCLLYGSIKYLNYDIQTVVVTKPFENILDSIIYKSNFLLIIHCFLYIAGNPRIIFSGNESSHSKLKSARRFLGKLVRMVRAIPLTITLFRQLRGYGLHCRLREMTMQEHFLLGKRIPRHLFVDYSCRLTGDKSTYTVQRS
jgi:hypothetical protein